MLPPSRRRSAPSSSGPIVAQSTTMDGIFWVFFFFLVYPSPHRMSAFVGAAPPERRSSSPEIIIFGAAGRRDYSRSLMCYDGTTAKPMLPSSYSKMEVPCFIGRDCFDGGNPASSRPAAAPNDRDAYLALHRGPFPKFLEPPGWLVASRARGSSPVNLRSVRELLARSGGARWVQSL